MYFYANERRKSVKHVCKKKTKIKNIFGANKYSYFVKIFLELYSKLINNLMDLGKKFNYGKSN